MHDLHTRHVKEITASRAEETDMIRSSYVAPGQFFFTGTVCLSGNDQKGISNIIEYHKTHQNTTKVDITFGRTKPKPNYKEKCQN